MTAPAKADTAGQHRGVFAVDEDAALAELELAWAGGGYHHQDPGTLAGQAMRKISQ